ncbi:hypothetical protein MRS44_007057 [Fusarium solani]|uniref:uncharacterized protein n=1 Tax=Fusarium solani TaxID=169388 RepID=UPI0032C499F4|nr:hypothetical protein MRS44_007057 [Fusarium solani]
MRQQPWSMWDDGQTLESPDRINMYNEADEVDGETPQETRNIIVFKRKTDVPGSERLVQQGGFAKTQNGANEMNLQSNRWLNCMDRFADEIQNLRLDDIKPQHDIKVALIDDGANPYVESLCARDAAKSQPGNANSRTVKDTEDNHKGINNLREAVKDALNSGILLFCAAADIGAITEVEYP